MKKRQWQPQEKFKIAKLCAKYQTCQAQYYQWRDRFLKEYHSAFDVKKQSLKKQRLENQISKLKRIIGDLTIELKKTSTSYEKTPISQTHRTRPETSGPNSSC